MVLEPPDGAGESRVLVCSWTCCLLEQPLIDRSCVFIIINCSVCFQSSVFSGGLCSRSGPLHSAGAADHHRGQNQFKSDPEIICVVLFFKLNLCLIPASCLPCCQAADQRAERDGKMEVFRKFPRKAPILYMPLITTLYYCCLYHYTESEVSLRLA